MISFISQSIIMNKLILSGAGGSSNWFPLLLPLLALLGAVWLVEYLVKYVKTKKLERENKLITKLTSTTDAEIIESTDSHQ